MAVEYEEFVAPPGDIENRVLEALAGGEPFVFVVGRLDHAGGIDLRVATQLPDAESVKALLRKTLDVMP